MMMMKVLESPAIYLWFKLTNMPFMYRTNVAYEVFLLCANQTVSLQWNSLPNKIVDAESVNTLRLV